MKTLFIFTIYTFITSVILAQTNYTDVIYLKSGNMHRGFIIEEVPNRSYTIVSAKKDTIVCTIDEIERITKEPLHKREVGYISGHLQPGYRRIIEIGHEFQVNDWSSDRLKLNLINAYQLNPFLSLGIGTGVRYYYPYDAVAVPIFADFRTNLMNTQTSPYLGLGLGYSFNVNNGISGLGVLLSPTAGVSFKAFNNAQMNLGVGFEMQRVRNWYSTNAVSVNLGISF